MPDLDAEHLSQSQRDQKARDHSDERQQVVLAAGGAGHAFEKLPAVQNPDAVEKHDQSREADRPDDLGLRRERANGETDEQTRHPTPSEKPPRFT